MTLSQITQFVSLTATALSLTCLTCVLRGAAADAQLCSATQCAAKNGQREADCPSPGSRRTRLSTREGRRSKAAANWARMTFCRDAPRRVKFSHLYMSSRGRLSGPWHAGSSSAGRIWRQTGGLVSDHHDHFHHITDDLKYFSLRTNSVFVILNGILFKTS